MRWLLVFVLGGCISPATVLDHVTEHVRDLATALEIQTDRRGKQPGKRILDDNVCRDNPLGRGCM